MENVRNISKIFFKFRKAMQFYNVRVLVVALARGGVTRRRSHELAFLPSFHTIPLRVLACSFLSFTLRISLSTLQALIASIALPAQIALIALSTLQALIALIALPAQIALIALSTLLR